MAVRSTQLTGAAGEFFVAGELSRLGWAAAVTPKGAPHTDVVAHNMETGRMVALQVKTATGRNLFRLRRTHEQPEAGEPDWFVLVSLPDEPREHPAFYVVPTPVVAAYVYIRHKLRSEEASKRAGAPRGEHDMRQADPADIQGYEGRWDLLSGGIEKAPHLLPEWVFEQAANGVGLPPGHAGLRRDGNIDRSR